jgi:hypothetical protein
MCGVMSLPTSQPRNLPVPYGIGGKPIRLQTQRFFGALDHGLGRGNFVIGAGRSGLHVDNHRVLDVDQVVEGIAELNTFVGFRGPNRARVYRRDDFW